MLEPVRVLEAQRGFARVQGVHGERLAPVPGPLRRGPARVGADGPPVTGDWVLAEQEGPVRAILERRSLLRRYDEVAGSEMLVGNADLAIVVSSLNQDFNLGRLERLLAIADEGDIPRMIGLSKCDLSSEPEKSVAEVAAELDADVLCFSSKTGTGVEAIRARLAPRRTTVLVGSSGVGKSTLVNTLLGEQRRHTLETRGGDDRGRHATTTRTLLRLSNGALLVDTPGLRSPRPASGEALDRTFPDVYEVTTSCRFGDCSHTGEPGCAVRAGIEDGRLTARRLQSFSKLQAEAQEAQERVEVDERKRTGGRRRPPP